jgi:coenzyme F420-reducing hydrogenase delta subunit
MTPTNTSEKVQSSGDETFDPKVLVFCCNWCSYAGADLAGVSRLQMPPHFRVIRVMCSGRVDPEHLLKAFSLGADGILVAGCHPADCHYIGGNYRTRRRIPMLKIMISQFGLEPSRLQLEWVSASEGERFQQVITKFIQHIQSLGPSPVGGG